MEPIGAPDGRVRPRFAGPETFARLHYVCGTVTSRPWPVALGMLALLWVSACGGPSQGSPGPSEAATGASASAPAATAGGSAAPAATTTPSSAPATPAATPIVNAGFKFGDVVKIQVNSLAARIAPKRSAALVHAYDITGPAPVDGGLVRLDKGDLVSVELGPVPVGDTAWYLVWPLPGGAQWYTTPPMDGSPLPAWVAASVGSAVYMKLDHAGSDDGSGSVAAAGRGAYVSAPQPRHDGFQLRWAAATPSSGESCSFKVELVPSDGDVDAKVAIQTTTTTVKVGPLDGTGVSAPWLPAPAGSWETFTVNVTGTCNWAFRLVRLEHD